MLLLMVYLDFIGLIVVLIFGFGWVRLVFVNLYNFKRLCLVGILVLIVGLISNLILSVIGLIIWYSLLKFGVLYLILFVVVDMLV